MIFLIFSKMQEGSEFHVFSFNSLDALLLGLWTLILVGAALSLTFTYVDPPVGKELLMQLSVVAFILLSAQRLGSHYDTPASIWFSGLYVVILVHSILFRLVRINVDLFIEHVFYAMMAYVCVIGGLRMYRHFFGSLKKKKIKKAE